MGTGNALTAAGKLHRQAGSRSCCSLLKHKETQRSIQISSAVGSASPAWVLATHSQLLGTQSLQPPGTIAHRRSIPQSIQAPRRWPPGPCGPACSCIVRRRGSKFARLKPSHCQPPGTARATVGIEHSQNLTQHLHEHEAVESKRHDVNHALPSLVVVHSSGYTTARSSRPHDAD
jgi:hypothetical protein